MTSFLLILVLLLWAPVAWSAPVQPVLTSGDPANRVDLAILGDGYTAAELPDYLNDVHTLLAGFVAESPFDAYQLYLNVHAVLVESAESGADKPASGIFRNTALGATYGCAGIQRLICVSASAVNTILLDSLPPEQRDLVLILVNDAEYGGAGGALAVASTHPAVVELVLHELAGHTLGHLADEYGGPPPPACVNTVEPPEANVTTATSVPLKWQAWIDPATPLPTPGPTMGLPGLYEGGKYCDVGLYRPTWASKMRVLGVPFEPVNTEQLVRRLYTFVSPIDAVSPPAGDLLVAQGHPLVLSVETLQPLSHDLEVSWWVDGVMVASEPTWTVDTSRVGTLDVTVVAFDPTALVREDPLALLQDARQWTVEVQPPGPPTLTLLPNQTVFHAGETLVMDVHVTNPTPLTLDLYYASILPDAHTVFWGTATHPFQGVLGDLGDSPATYTPLLRHLAWPGGWDARHTNALTYTWSGTEPPGEYRLLLGWVVPDSLADGSIDPGDIIVQTWTTLTFAPSPRPALTRSPRP